ncbi:hypothetical protein GCM10009425_48530 [Pseudomonas asuensis]|uniref:Uncharacterized protein n=1 Tax=Pseudomonas asuensis TaxID=1825787 RepID=A0ABQ2H537_9PSED|nr:hypothetical protein GCM10009425_48530 [Pseudomonas asuensis]
MGEFPPICRCNIPLGALRESLFGDRDEATLLPDEDGLIYSFNKLSEYAGGLGIEFLNS